ncbi:MAG TPA: toll/interleukin-1 receptor domain-containing protein [Pyrinomonadaceae bacterium]|nr:toll/interleukin-1 receptor domain-containing protein [Pyrinomonadaceae bacterium]
MGLKVFISWSGNESQFVASRLRKLLKRICAGAEPWTSKDDLSAGALWPSVLMEQLKSTHFGIVCVNRANLGSAWLHFEAGALAKSMDASAVFPYLIDVPPSALSGPLTLFQCVSANKSGTFKLVSALNRILNEKQEASQADDDLQALFDLLWPDYERELLLESPKVPIDAGPERSNTEILGELLTTTREHSRLLASLLRAQPQYRLPIQSAEQPCAAAPDEDYTTLSFQELRYNAKRLRLSGQYATALALLQKALTLQANDLETLIDIAVTETYLPNSVYADSIRKLSELVQEHATQGQTPRAEESIIAKAFYNIACIKHLARLEQEQPYSDAAILDDLERAFARYPAYVNTALADHDLTQLKTHPKFKELIEKYRGADR